MKGTTLRVILVAFLAGFVIGYAGQAGKALKEFLNLGGHRPPGYSQVVTSAPGKMIFISGRGGSAQDGTLPTDFDNQTINTFEDLKRCLALAGASFKDVVKINYFVKDLSNTTALRTIRAKYLDMDHPPAATLVQVGLGGGALIEIEAVAIIPE